jgi:hypothetical protein
MKKIYLFSFLILLSSCSKDEKIQPVDILEITPQLRSIQDQADQMGRDIQDNIQTTLNEAQARLLAEQRDVSLQLMKLTSIKDIKKLKLAMKYFALFDFQLYENSEDFEFKSVQLFLADTKTLFPTSLELKQSMRKDKSFNLYALAIAMDTINPNRTAPAESFMDLVLLGLSKEATQMGSNNETAQLIKDNRNQFKFLLQLRHNALYDITIQYFDKTPLNIFKRFTVTGENLDLETIENLHKMLILADLTRDRLKTLEIPIQDFKNRRNKLKAMRLKIHKSVKTDIANALIDLHRHIQENY